MTQEKLILDYDRNDLERHLHFAQEGVKPEPAYSKKWRDENGQWKNGNKGGPGNPFNRQVAALRKAMLAAITAEDILQITQAMIAKAKEGNVAAAKIVLQYAVGKPTEAPDPDRVDVDEWKLTQESGLRPEAVVQAATEVPVKEALKGTEVLRDMFYVGQREAIAAALKEKTGPVPISHRDEETQKVLRESEELERAHIEKMRGQWGEPEVPKDPMADYKPVYSGDHRDCGLAAAR